jgi:RNA polymerase sigma-70 factor (ECF subfamily)
MTEEEDAALMSRYVRGDVRAFQYLYERHRAPLYRYLMRHTRNADTANDLFQEAWSKLIASRERYEPRAKFQTFLFHIAHNCFIDHCRRSAARPADAGDAAYESLAAVETTQPDRRAESSQILAHYRAALAALPAEQRDVFLLHEESGLSLEEIGRVTGVGAETAKSRLRYAITKLRTALEPYRPAPFDARFEGAKP